MDHDNEFIIIVFPLTFDIFYQWTFFIISISVILCMVFFTTFMYGLFFTYFELFRPW